MKLLNKLNIYFLAITACVMMQAVMAIAIQFAAPIDAEANAVQTTTTTTTTNVPASMKPASTPATTAPIPADKPVSVAQAGCQRLCGHNFGQQEPDVVGNKATCLDDTMTHPASKGCTKYGSGGDDTTWCIEKDITITDKNRVNKDAPTVYNCLGISQMKVTKHNINQ